MLVRRYLSTVALISANLIPLYGVLYLGWSVFSILFLYWLESAIIGGFNILKMKKAMAPVPSGYTKPTNLPDLELIPFFMLHYGLFMLVHGVFVFAFFWPPDIALRQVLIAFFSLFVSHGLSYQLNFVGNREYTKISPDQQMIQPYGRILVMHMTILFGAVLSKSFGAPPIALVIMVVLKVVIDLLAHWREHFPFSDV